MDRMSNAVIIPYVCNTKGDNYGKIMFNDITLKTIIDNLDKKLLLKKLTKYFVDVEQSKLETYYYQNKYILENLGQYYDLIYDLIKKEIVVKEIQY